MGVDIKCRGVRIRLHQHLRRYNAIVEQEEGNIELVMVDMYQSVVDVVPRQRSRQFFCRQSQNENKSAVAGRRTLMDV